MQRNSSKQVVAAKFCLLVLCVILFLAGCGGYKSPGSQPNGTPQATPTNGGYSIIYVIDHEMQVLLAAQGR